MRLISREYYDFNPTHLAEELVKLYDIRIAAQTLRRWMKQETLRRWMKQERSAHSRHVVLVLIEDYAHARIIAAS